MRPFFCALLLVASLIAARADIPRQPPARDEILAAFRWFDTLRYEDVSRLPLVEVSGGQPSSDLNANHHRYAFLLEETSTSIRVLFPNLETSTLQKGAPTPKRANYQPADLISLATTAIAQLETDAKSGLSAWDGFADDTVSLPELFVVARACAASENIDLGCRLVARALTVLKLPEPHWPFVRGIAEATASMVLETIYTRFPRRAVTRQELAAEMREAAVRFPDTGAGAVAHQAADLIDRMVREDVEHSRKPAGEDTHGRIAELIFELRDARSLPLPVEFDPLWRSHTPVTRLAGIGVYAIPELIKAVSDHRLSRCVGTIIKGWESVRKGGSGYAHAQCENHLLTVGDVALALIDRIADADFAGNGCTEGGAIKPGKLPVVLGTLKQWWSTYHLGEDLRTLSASVTSADADAGGSADLLIRRFPAQALPAIRRGLNAAKVEGTAIKLLWAAAQLNDPGTPDLLDSQATRGISLNVRLAANRWLEYRRNLSGPLALVMQWQGAPGSVHFQDFAQSRVAALELIKAYTWFDTLGYPDVRTLPFVLVNAVASGEGLSRTEAERRVGFLVNNSRTTFTVFYPDLTTKSYDHEPTTVIGAHRTDMQPVDLTNWVQARVSLFDAEHGWEDRWSELGFVDDVRYEVLVIARACAARGHAPLAAELYNAFDATAGHSSAIEGSGFQGELDAAMAQDCAGRAITLLDNPQTPRAIILADLQAVIKRFPDTKCVSEIQGTVRVLQNMVREDAEHDAAKATQHGNVSETDRIGELIYELRDQHGCQINNPGEPDPFNDPRGEASPASQLVKIGTSAIPALIRALDSHFLTRTLKQSNFAGYVPRIVTVGDAARAVIERIAQRSFYDRDAPAPAIFGCTAIASDEERATIKAKILKWWSESSVADGA